MSTDAKPTLLLVHGAWHGSWCWEFQIPELRDLGYAVETVDLPCTSGTAGTTQFDDAAAVRSAIEPLLAAGKRVVVVAHSYGGPMGCWAVSGLSEAERAGKGLPGGVLGMIALCAYVFPGGMDQGAAIRSVGGLSYVDWDTPAEGLFLCKDPRSLFYLPDVSDDRAEWALRQLRPQSMAANMGIVPPQAWQDDSNYEGLLGYIRATADPIIPLADQDAMIAGAGGVGKWVVRTLEGSGHSPFLSRPRDVARSVGEIVKEFESTRKDL